MIFHETKLKGSFVIEPELRTDGPWLFLREPGPLEDFQARGLRDRSGPSAAFRTTRNAGTLRLAMHWQAPPHEDSQSFGSLRLR